MGDCTTYPLERIRLALPEGRLDHDLTQAEFAEVSGTSQSAVSRAELGGHVSPAALVRMGLALLALDVYRVLDDPRPPAFEEGIDALLWNGRVPLARPPVLARPSLPAELGVAS